MNRQREDLLAFAEKWEPVMATIERPQRVHNTSNGRLPERLQDLQKREVAT